VVLIVVEMDAYSKSRRKADYQTALYMYYIHVLYGHFVTYTTDLHTRSTLIFVYAKKIFTASLPEYWKKPYMEIYYMIKNSPRVPQVP